MLSAILSVVNDDIDAISYCLPTVGILQPFPSSFLYPLICHRVSRAIGNKNYYESIVPHHEIRFSEYADV